LGLGKLAAQAPDLAVGAIEGFAHEKRAKAKRDYAEGEKESSIAELNRRTLESKERQECATADRLETEARLARLSELSARLKLLEKLKRLQVLPMWGKDGKMIFVPAPTCFDWHGLQRKLLNEDNAPMELLLRDEHAGTDEPEVP